MISDARDGRGWDLIPKYISSGETDVFFVQLVLNESYDLTKGSFLHVVGETEYRLIENGNGILVYFVYIKVTNAMKTKSMGQLLC